MKRIIRKLYRILSSSQSTNHCWKIREKALYSRSILRYMYKYIFDRKMRKFGAFIPLSASFAGKPVFPHDFYGIFISSGAKIGTDCTIFHHVTIGSNTLLDTKHHGAPTIVNNVYIGAGAKIIGSIHVGNNVRIGANCVVVKDIPDNSTVVLPTSRVIEHDCALNNQFVKWSNEVV